MHRAEPGWNRIEIVPKIPAALDSIAGTLDTPRGRISVSIKRDRDTLCAAVTMPEGTDGIFRYGDAAEKLHAGENLIRM